VKEMGRACDVLGKKRNTHRVLVGSLKQTDQLVDLGVNGRILTRALKKCDRAGLIWLGIGQSGVLL
jgi:hypothetical protein